MSTRDYIIELISSWNSEIDTSEGSDFDEKVIQPLLDYLGTDPFEEDTNIITFLQEKIKAYDSSINPVPGTAIYDLLVGPLYLIIAALRREIANLRRSGDISAYQSLTEEAMDALASNFLLSRRSGTKATTTVRVYFTNPTNVTILPTAYFSTSDDLKFYPTSTVQVTSDQMALNFEDGFYYADISVEAEEAGTAYNVGANSIVNAIGLTGYIKVTNPYPVINGTDKESNEELYQRILDSITERTPTTERGIRTLVMENFPYVQYVNVVGASDPEMTRDLVPIYTNIPGATGEAAYPDYYIKTGNKIDVYALTSDHQPRSLNLASITTEISLSSRDDDGNVTSLIDLPLIRIIDVEILDPATLSSTGIYIPRRDPIGIRAITNFTGGEVGKAQGTVRMLFTRPTYLSITPDMVFTASNGYQYVPLGAYSQDPDSAQPGQVIGASQMDTQREIYGNITYYYYDIQVQSLAAGDANTNVPAYTSFTVSEIDAKGWWVESQDSAYAFSTKEGITIKFTETYDDLNTPVEGLSVRIIYETSETITDLQNFLENDEYRCVVADPLAKAYEPIYTHVHIDYRGDSLSEEYAVELIQNFLLSLTPGEDLEVSDLINLLYRSGASYVSLPVYVLLEYHRSDRKIETIVVTDSYTIPRTSHPMLGTISTRKL